MDTKPPSSDAEAPSVLRQASVFYVWSLIASLVSFPIAALLAGVLDAAVAVPFFWGLIAPFFVTLLLFVQIDRLVDRRIQLHHAGPSEGGEPSPDRGTCEGEEDAVR